jgi:glycosidase
VEIQFFLNQPKIIYYGTEIGMTQGKSIYSTPYHGDVFARQAMQWENFDEALLLFYQHLIDKYKTNYKF